MVKKQIDYQTLSTKLDEVLAELQASDVHVDEAMRLYKKGLDLVEQLQERLQQTENKLEILKANMPVR
ncbi:MAG TPA: exodeoxyribonuclease VII small subunit [Candidatus Saccharimonadales bacterium]|nr:exodeoxyribonuclease VII small subunit [Candidatus Saccharimonadales bacterium]